MAAKFESPFDSGFKDTASQTASGGTSQGPAPDKPAADYPIPAVITELGTSGATFEDVFRDAIVNSTSVESANPSGSAPCDSPFKDALAKY